MGLAGCVSSLLCHNLGETPQDFLRISLSALSFKLRQMRHGMHIFMLLCRRALINKEIIQTRLLTCGGKPVPQVEKSEPLQPERHVNPSSQSAM